MDELFGLVVSERARPDRWDGCSPPCGRLFNIVMRRVRQSSGTDPRFCPFAFLTFLTTSARVIRILNEDFSFASKMCDTCISQHGSPHGAPSSLVFIRYESRYLSCNGSKIICSSFGGTVILTFAGTYMANLRVPKDGFARVSFTLSSQGVM